MLKKILSILLILALALSISACGQDNASDTNLETTLPTEELEILDIPEETEEVLTVEDDSVPIALLLPSSLIPKQELPYIDWDAFATEHGFIAAEMTEGGDICVTLTETHQTEILNRLSVEIDNLIATYVQGEATPYIQDILCGENYSVFTIKVDAKDYKASFDFASTTLGQKALEYQLYSGNEYTVTVSIADAISGKAIHSFTYPEV